MTSSLNPALGAVRRRLGTALAALAGRRRADTETLILFYNTMWDQPIDTESTALPDGCRLSTDPTRLGESAAVVFHIPSLDRLPASKAPGQLWVAWSLESEANYPQLRDPEFMGWFDLTMSYRLDADVVDSYVSYYGDGANLVRALRVPAGPKTADRPATLFISSGMNLSGRFEYATELMRHLQVDSFGKMLQNRVIEQDAWRPSKLEIIARYKFNLAFENSISEDYVTEKFFDPLVAGTVPVYLGAPNVERFAPGDRCYINTADFAEPRELAEYLRHLARDDAAYESYLAWKQHPYRPAFLELLAQQDEPRFARLCRAVQARRGGSL